MFEGWFHPPEGEAMDAGQKANRRMWQMIIAAAGAGILGRGGLGLLRMMRPESSFEPAPTFQPVGIKLPHEEESEEEKFSMDKEAVWPISQLSEGASKLTEGLPWGETLFFGRGASHPNNVPALLGLGLPLSALALYGGWKGTDALLDWRRKREMEGELEKTREEYERLLNETLAKHGADEAGIEAELDELAEMATTMEKDAGYPSDFLSKGYGFLAAYAMLSALASGKLSYDYFKKRNQRTVAEEALKRRAKERTGGVAPIYLQPSTEIA
jgi:hypothetical protein